MYRAQVSVPWPPDVEWMLESQVSAGRANGQPASEAGKEDSPGELVPRGSGPSSAHSINTALFNCVPNPEIEQHRPPDRTAHPGETSSRMRAAKAYPRGWEPQKH